MRRVAGLIAGGTVAAAGCFAPFSWPGETRRLPDPPPAVGPPADAAADHLALAAACVDRGDDAAALPHLQAHVADHPDAVMIRAYLAELLLKRGRPADARREFERFTRDAVGVGGPAERHLVHAHTRLMELAEADGDAFAEWLHRGAGLLLLVRQWDADPERRDEAMAERTLTKAAAALKSARDERPDDPRPSAWLAEVYDRLGQPSAARAARRTAAAAGPELGTEFGRDGG